MVDERFFTNSGPYTIEQIVAISGAVLHQREDASKSIDNVAPLDRATTADVSFLDNNKYVEHFEQSKAGACFVREKYISKAPKGMTLLINEDPYRAYALAAQTFYPKEPPLYRESNRSPWSRRYHIAQYAHILPGSFIGEGVVIEDGAEIGESCIIDHNAVILKGVKIGNNTHIGPMCCISHAEIGNNCIIHRGVNIGQDGFGFAMGRGGHIKVPQLGRVIIEDNVEIGAGACIDRGTGPDTHIGEGSKIDNLVQIGHNVQVGRGAVIVAQTGIAGSSRIGDGAVLAGQAGIAGHIRIGAGAKIAAQAGVMHEVPAGASVGGSPAMPVKEWHRQTIALKKMGKGKKESNG